MKKTSQLKSPPLPPPGEDSDMSDDSQFQQSLKESKKLLMVQILYFLVLLAINYLELNHCEQLDL